MSKARVKAEQIVAARKSLTESLGADAADDDDDYAPIVVDRLSYDEFEKHVIGWLIRQGIFS